MSSSALRVGTFALLDSFRIVLQGDADLLLGLVLESLLAPAHSIIAIAATGGDCAHVRTSLVTESDMEYPTVLSCCGPIVNAVCTFLTLHVASPFWLSVRASVRVRATWKRQFSGSFLFPTT